MLTDVFLIDQEAATDNIAVLRMSLLQKCDSIHCYRCELVLTFQCELIHRQLEQADTAYSDRTNAYQL